jgi:putative ABC transport system substrate-binding protein
MRRREFIALAGAAAAPASCAVSWPLAARAQQPAMPVIGLLGVKASLNAGAFAQGLKETGYVPGQNVLVHERWVEGAYDRFPAMAAELVDLRVSVLHVYGTTATRAAKPASVRAVPAVPVVFSLGADPVAEGFVASLNRPGGNMTGVTSIAGSLAPKRLELLRTFLRDNVAIALLVNPDNPLSQAERNDTEAAARAIGQRLDILAARNETEIDAVFAALKDRRVGALIIAVDTFYYAQMPRMAALATRYAVPAISPLRDFAEAGGLMTYGASIYDVNRQAAVYVGRVLKGARPADLPVLQPTKFELLINLKTAKALGLDVPQTLLATADEVIE